MHELSLALEVCRIAERAVGTALLPRVREVELELGADADVEVDHLTFCLEALLSSRPFTRATPRIVRAPGDDLRVLSLEVDDDDP